MIFNSYAKCKAVAPQLAVVSGFTPLESKYSKTFTCPLNAAIMRQVLLNLLAILKSPFPVSTKNLTISRRPSKHAALNGVDLQKRAK